MHYSLTMFEVEYLLDISKIEDDISPVIEFRSEYIQRVSCPHIFELKSTRPHVPTIHLLHFTWDHFNYTVG